MDDRNDKGKILAKEQDGRIRNWIIEDIRRLLGRLSSLEKEGSHGGNADKG